MKYNNLVNVNEYKALPKWRKKKQQTKQNKFRNRSKKWWKNKDCFYNSREWKAVRYKAIKIHGKVCACCETKVGPFHVDHIKPRSKYPELALDIDNLQVLCADCNTGKGRWDETDWRK